MLREEVERQKTCKNGRVLKQMAIAIGATSRIVAKPLASDGIYCSESSIECSPPIHCSDSGRNWKCLDQVHFRANHPLG